MAEQHPPYEIEGSTYSDILTTYNSTIPIGKL